MSDDPVCPGEECPYCSNEMCKQCGAGLWAPPRSTQCEHEIVERHHYADEAMT